MLFIAENLKSLRRRDNMTQEEVAELLGVSPQSVSKWERGDTFPDITLLPALANLYHTSVDALVGMDRIREEQTKSALYTAEREHLRHGDYRAAANVMAEALKTFPGDVGFMSELAFALALDGEEEHLAQAITLCERILEKQKGDKVYDTTRAALSFMYLKAGEREKAVSMARQLPHMRESREAILAEFEKEWTRSDLNAYLKFLSTGDLECRA